ncbi:MAG: outer membrane lipoprotein carrier protein LolA [Endomicrobiales bacterium]|nr:outer membrane lipoprotein carrier protein LolA [Endomicrobiales bacterium]
MKVRKQIIFFVLLFISPLNYSYTKEISIDDILSRLENEDKKIESVRFSFHQEIQYTLTKEKQVTTGEVAFKKPDNLYLKQDKPVEQIFISDGKKIWIYTPQYGQLVVDSWKKWLKSGFVPSSIISFSSDWSELQKNYDFSYIGSEGNFYIILLKPNIKSKEMFNPEKWQLKLWIDSKDLVPYKVSLEGENVSIITKTRDYKINPELNKNMFEFKKPKGVETIEMP